MKIATATNPCTDPSLQEWLYDYCLKNLSAEQTEKFELHLLQCTACQKEVAKMDRVFSAMRKTPEYFKKKLSTPQPWRGKRLLKYPIAAVLVLGLGWTALAYWGTPSYYALATLSAEFEFDHMKGEVHRDDFATALDHLRQKKYDAAIAEFSGLVQAQPQNFQVNYFLSLAYLAAGEKIRLGWRSFSTTHTQKALHYLETAEQLAGDNQFYREDCLWLLGKAWLRLEDVEKAKQTWRAILALPAPDLIHKAEARRLLAELN